MEKYWMARDVAWGLAAIALGTLVAWWLLARVAKRLRRHFDALLAMAQDSLDAPHDVAAVRARMTALRLLMNAAKYALVVSAILMVLRRLGVQLDALLLPAGFVGAALGLGAQNLVRDVVAGLFLVLEGQFAVGDVVGINGTIGTIDEIGLRVTRLRDEASHIHFFPNGAINAVEKYPREPFFLLLRVPLDPRYLAAAPVATTDASQTAQVAGATSSIANRDARAANPGSPGTSSAKLDEGLLTAPAAMENTRGLQLGTGQNEVAPKSQLQQSQLQQSQLQQSQLQQSLSDARALVLHAVQHFDADYHALEGRIEILPSSVIDAAPEDGAVAPLEKMASAADQDNGGIDLVETPEALTKRENADVALATLCFRLPVRALRAALVREKLPPRVLSVLEGSGLKVRPGTEVGLFTASIAQNETA
jgi:hypothetical protein